MQKVPDKLYHSDIVRKQTIVPTTRRPGIIDELDKPELIYATEDPELAICAAIAQAITTITSLKNFSIDGEKVFVDLYVDSVPITVSDVVDLEVFLYTIATNSKQTWRRNYNTKNNLLGEWITSDVIHFYERVTTLPISKWLDGKEFVVRVSK